MTQVPPNRTRNQKYDKELLSDVVKNALRVQGIPEAFEWLEKAVEQADIPVGRALEDATPPGALGPLHEVGAAPRLAKIQIITASEALADDNLFWQLPESAVRHPRATPVARPLPAVRYESANSVPPELKHAGDSDDASPRQPVPQAKKKERRPRKKAVPQSTRSKRKRVSKAPAKSKRRTRRQGTSLLTTSVPETSWSRWTSILMGSASM